MLLMTPLLAMMIVISDNDDESGNGYIQRRLQQ